MEVVSMTEEVWKPIVGYEGSYEVSSTGMVRRLRRSSGARVGRILKSHDNGEGYLFVPLCINNTRRQRTVHRVVAEAFYGPALGRQVNHKNGNKQDNRVENIEWVTPKENSLHSYRVLHNKQGSKHPMAKLTEACISTIRNMLANGQTMGSIGRRFGVHLSTVRDIRTGRTWSHV
jgi:hypothetical protein